MGLVLIVEDALPGSTCSGCGEKQEGGALALGHGAVRSGRSGPGADFARPLGNCIQRVIEDNVNVK